MQDLKPKRGSRQAEKEQNKLYWEKHKNCGPYSGRLVYKIAQDNLDGKRISAGELNLALEYLYDVTSDDGFRSALLSLRSYGLITGGLQQATLQLMRKSGRDTLTSAAKFMSNSSQAEAERVAAQYGVPGQSFETVVRELSSARKALEKKISGEEPEVHFPSGDTGRRMLVKLAIPWFSDPECTKLITSLFGVKFDDDGFAVAPDNRDWRREISAGRVASFGYLAEGDERGEQRRDAWKKLAEFSGRKSLPESIDTAPQKT